MNVTLTVTEEDRVRAIQEMEDYPNTSSARCVVAVSMNRQLGGCHSVGSTSALELTRGRFYVFSELLSLEIRRFDNDGTFCPGDYSLEEAT